MYLIGKTVNGEKVGWLHNAEGKKYDADKLRKTPIIVKWTRVAYNAKVYQKGDDARYVCEMIWGKSIPADVTVNEVQKSESESGELNVG